METPQTQPCADCDVVPVVGVHAATDGWYVGAACACGEKHRVVERTFPTYDEARAAQLVLNRRGEGYQ